MSIPEFIDSLADFGILTNNVTDIFDRLNEGVSEEVSILQCGNIARTEISRYFYFPMTSFANATQRRFLVHLL